MGVQLIRLQVLLTFLFYPRDMRLIDILPAISMTLVVTLVLGCLPLLAVGETTVLVRVPPGEPAAALRIAAAAGAVLVSEPSPGFAVLFGDAARIRNVTGLAVTWKGAPACVQRL